MSDQQCFWNGCGGGGSGESGHHAYFASAPRHPFTSVVYCSCWLPLYHPTPQSSDDSGPRYTTIPHEAMLAQGWVLQGSMGHPASVSGAFRDGKIQTGKEHRGEPVVSIQWTCASGMRDMPVVNRPCRLQPQSQGRRKSQDERRQRRETGASRAEGHPETENKVTQVCPALKTLKRDHKRMNSDLPRNCHQHRTLGAVFSGWRWPARHMLHLTPCSYGIDVAPP